MAGQPFGLNYARVMPRLKDFQRATVDYVFRRMYYDEDRTTRFLVADEVGLGKTMVATGIIARALDELEDKVERIDIIYVCSNSAIARQNVNKLAMPESSDVVLSSRITLLPLEARRIRNRPVNLISFTPATSFNLRSSLGVAQERVLLYYLVTEAWGIQSTNARAVLRGAVDRQRFGQMVRGFAEGRIDDQLAGDFIIALRQQPALAEEFGTLAEDLRQAERRQLGADLRKRQRQVIGSLRDVLAKACLRALEPDLIILDEFQRFKHLLDDEDDESILARELFDHCDHDGNRARVLLLSATPYKMFTESDDAGGNDHYQDFLVTVRFLQQNAGRTSRTEALLDEYRHELLRADRSLGPRLHEVKRELEVELRRVMVRTERLAVTADRDGMLTTVPCPSLGIEPREALTYRQLGRIAERLEHADPIEYWKSAPYLLSFMEDYRLKHAVNDALDDPERSREIGALVDQSLSLTLPFQEMERYRRLDPANARMRWLVERAVDCGAWKLLWVPPSRPSYQLAGPFAEPGVATFTKLLVFSGWKVVPKAIAALVSYEAERRMMEAGGSEENTAEARKRFSPVLRANQENLLTLTYPSFSLAGLASEVLDSLPAPLPSADSVLDLVAGRIGDALAQLPSSGEGGQPDPKWYWIGPAILDWREDPAAAEEWFSQKDLTDSWADPGDEDVDRIGDQLRLTYLAGAAAEGGVRLGARPDDLARVLASIALAGPATVALRAIRTGLGGAARLYEPSIRNAAARVGWALRGYFNLPEVVHLLRGVGADAHYWQLVLQYGIDGCLGAVLDEYVHVLIDWLGLHDRTPADAANQIREKVVEALSLRTANLAADSFVSQPDGTVTREQRRLRSRYAVRLASEDGDNEKITNRIDHVRTAFNSPFWPFVLATTSVGQEGLDFHLYCHAVVHWNLPSNPVDLEQREGRVHRYKGHAVRKNVVRRHGDEPAIAGFGDLWSSMFKAAEACRPAGATEVWPFWIYPVDGGAKIERHVPALPLSRDVARLERVRRWAAMYRLVFGQMRQEDLLSGPAANWTELQNAGALIDLQPPVGPPQQLE